DLEDSHRLWCRYWRNCCGVIQLGALQSRSAGGEVVGAVRTLRSIRSWMRQV
ncbi:hypothetical protein XENOCAPTIV_003735, partial [Xenoophorus captivus]